MGRFAWNCAFSGDSVTEMLSASISGTAAVWNHPTAPPGNILEVPEGWDFNTFRGTKGASIGSGGGFTFQIDSPIGNVNTFGFTVW